MDDEHTEATTITANKLVRRPLQFQVETSRRIRSQGGLQSEFNGSLLEIRLSSTSI